MKRKSMTVWHWYIYIFELLRMRISTLIYPASNRAFYRSKEIAEELRHIDKELTLEKTFSKSDIT